MNLTTSLNNFLTILALPFDVLSSGLLLVVCALAVVFAKRVSLWVFLPMLGAGLLFWFGWQNIFVFAHPAGIDSGNYEIAGFAFTEETKRLLQLRPDIAAKEVQERNSTLLLMAGGAFSQVWTGFSLHASRLFGLITTCIFAAGLVGAPAKLVRGYAASWLRR